jgi:hypothetical protein
VSLAAAQQTFQAPILGCTLDEQGRLRPLLGIPANFVVGEPLLEGAAAASCSATHAVVKTPRELLVMDTAGRVLHRMEAPDESLLAAFDEQGEPAFAVLDRRVLRWSGGHWGPYDAPLEPALAISSKNGKLLAVVRTDGGVQMRSFAGDGSFAVIASFDGRVNRAAISGDGALLVAAGDSVTVHYPDGRRLEIPTPGEVQSLALIGWSLAEVRLPEQRLAIDLRYPEPALLILPGLEK